MLFLSAHFSVRCSGWALGSKPNPDHRASRSRIGGHRRFYAPSHTEDVCSFWLQDWATRRYCMAEQKAGSFQASKSSKRTSARSVPNSHCAPSNQMITNTRPPTTGPCYACLHLEHCRTAIRVRLAKQTKQVGTRLLDFLPSAWADLGFYAIRPFLSHGLGPPVQLLNV